MMSEISAGVKALVNRMKTNPEEFFDPKEYDRWSFIYKETFRDVMNEQEKAAIHTALSQVRRKEFETRVLKEILNAGEDEDEEEQEGLANVKFKSQGRYGQTQTQAKS
jgi:hypothetical protein